MQGLAAVEDELVGNVISEMQQVELCQRNLAMLGHYLTLASWLHADKECCMLLCLQQLKNSQTCRQHGPGHGNSMTQRQRQASQMPPCITSRQGRPPMSHAAAKQPAQQCRSRGLGSKTWQCRLTLN